MDSTFQSHVDSLEPSFHELISMTPEKRDSLGEVPAQGIYLLSEGEEHLYVGRSGRSKNGMRSRIMNHISGGHNKATFAFLLAREATGNLKPTYTRKGSRAELEKDPEFLKAFESAKERIRYMDVRYAGEPDPIRQALLEMYASVALKTPYNDFGTH